MDTCTQKIKNTELCSCSQIYFTAFRSKGNKPHKGLKHPQGGVQKDLWPPLDQKKGNLLSSSTTYSLSLYFVYSDFFPSQHRIETLEVPRANFHTHTQPFRMQKKVSLSPSLMPLQLS